ncbi:hypothetical protein PHYPO_G00046200 [Pangasianodon hypophthalmus]|uniref:Uncharacterized protein n=1 Tax=Pangasianodon hypophthalmus TaxID=310915 RepID=A0A5N5MI56_PANHP|nr:hypothetical protein PHYPO_G00046200 [Pangasianodon hypophthalmus]
MTSAKSLHARLVFWITNRLDKHCCCCVFRLWSWPCAGHVASAATPRHVTSFVDDCWCVDRSRAQCHSSGADVS